MYSSYTLSTVKEHSSLLKDSIQAKISTIDSKITMIALAIFAAIMTGVSIYLYMENRRLKATQPNANVAESKSDQVTATTQEKQIEQNRKEEKEPSESLNSTNNLGAQKINQARVAEKSIPKTIYLAINFLNNTKIGTFSELSTEQTIESLKARMHAQSGHLPGEYTLVHRGKKLDDKMKIKDYENFDELQEDGKVIAMKNLTPTQPTEMSSVKIRTLTGHVFKCDFFPEETIGCLKARIHEKEKIPYAEIRLLVGGHDCADDTLVKDCKLDPKDPIFHLILRPKQP